MKFLEWKTREDLQVRLDAALEEPLWKDVKATLVAMGIPDGTQVADINLNALKNAYNEGYFKCLANLELLRSCKEVAKKPMPQPWVKTAPPDANN